jgi:hypothetical protein
MIVVIGMEAFVLVVVFVVVAGVMVVVMVVDGRSNLEGRRKHQRKV